MTVTVNEGWEARFEQVKNTGLAIQVYIPIELRDMLDESEIRRLNVVKEMVEKSATRQLQNMVKGVVKYKEGDHTVDEWMDLLTDDAGDTNNYIPLLGLAIEKERDKHALALGQAQKAGVDSVGQVFIDNLINRRPDLRDVPPQTERTIPR